jgi:hypothetical protein
MFLELTGTGGGTLVVPAKRKLYFIYNNTSTAITVKVSGLTGVSVPAAAKVILVNNGTDIVIATNYMPSLTLGAALLEPYTFPIEPVDTPREITVTIEVERPVLLDPAGTDRRILGVAVREVWVE